MFFATKFGIWITLAITAKVTAVFTAATTGADAAASEQTKFESTAKLLKCPIGLDSPMEVPEVSFTSISEAIPILLPPSASDRLCALSRISGDNYEPIGRSYGGHDWEVVSGPEFRNQYKCGIDPVFSATERYCQIILQKPTSGADATYSLTSYMSSLSDTDKIARFLERTTFGATRGDIAAFQQLQEETAGGLRLAQATWVKDQILNAGITSHREYWRKVRTCSG